MLAAGSCGTSNTAQDDEPSTADAAQRTARASGGETGSTRDADDGNERDDVASAAIEADERAEVAAPGSPGVDDSAESTVTTPDGARREGPVGGCSLMTPAPLVGWASVAGRGTTTTTGGGSGPIVTVSTLAELNASAGDAVPRVVQIGGTIAGDVTVGSNKTIVGLCGAEVHGHVQMTGSVNVIVRNLTIVGNNCADSPSDCSSGADAVTVEDGAHHIWFDHDDISDGSDGNLDITHASDFVTVSWTRFHYSERRDDPAGASGGHQFSNLVGHSDSNAAEDSGHLTVTFHHDWWADNVVERMPRVRFGRVHVYNSLYTSAGDDSCIGVGVDADIRDENNVFVGVKDPIDATSYSNAASVIQSTGDALTAAVGASKDTGGGAFTPPYAYSLDPTSRVEAEVMARAGVE